MWEGNYRPPELDLTSLGKKPQNQNTKNIHQHNLIWLSQLRVPGPHASVSTYGLCLPWFDAADYNVEQCGLRLITKLKLSSV
jgi:hypothetical protein